MKSLLGWVVIALTAVFVVFNVETVRVGFLGIRIEMPLALVVIASAFLGALATYAFMSLKRSK